MKIVTRIFTNADELSNIKENLSNFLNVCCKNPFSLYPFIENYIRSYCQDSIPAILVSCINKKIVGVVPLQLRKTVVFQRATFLLPYFFSPDFLLDDDYREEILRNFLYIIVKKIKCKQIVLVLSLPFLAFIYSDSSEFGFCQSTTLFRKKVLLLKNEFASCFYHYKNWSSLMVTLK